MHIRNQSLLFFVLFTGLLAAAIICQGCVYVSGRNILGTGPGPFKETFVTGSGRDKILFMDVSGIISE